MASSLTTVRDIPLLITSPSVSTERRITPSWTIAHVKTKLELVAGIPSSSQVLSLQLPDQEQTTIEAEDEDSMEIGQWPLRDHAEIKVTSRAGESNLVPSLSSVEKYTMPKSAYEELPETVLAFKKAHQVGRFDPDAPRKREQKVKDMWKVIEKRDIKTGARCHLYGENHRRGSVDFIGAIEELPGPPGAPWIGIALDEPTGKNDGSVKGKRYFECQSKFGVFVRADFVVVGDFSVIALDPDMEEI